MTIVSYLAHTVLVHWETPSVLAHSVILYYILQTLLLPN